MTDKYDPSPEQFAKDVADWKMEVLNENGLYRHLRFRMASGGFRWFDIVTWPGKLVITGDCETFTFARLEDMFDFFRQGGTRINPGYWQEKICDGRDRARGFDWDRFCMEALENFDSVTRGETDIALLTAAREDLENELDDAAPDKWSAVQLLREYAYRASYDQPPYFQFDLSDSPPDGEGWDFHYIWCCRAIAWAIEQYDKSKVMGAA